jgi:hypothetical protein
MEKTRIKAIQAKIYWRLKVQSQGGLSNLAYLYNKENIPVELIYTAGLHRHIQWGWQPKDL